MNPIGKNLHLDISTSRPVLDVFPTSHPAVRLPLNLEEIIIIIMFNHVCINNVKWKDTFSSYMRMSPPWGLCFIFLVEPTFAKVLQNTFSWLLFVFAQSKPQGWWQQMIFSELYLWLRFPVEFPVFNFDITSPRSVGRLLVEKLSFLQLCCISWIYRHNVSILNMISVNVKVHLLKGSDFWLCSPIQLPLLDLRTIKDQR